MVAQHGPDEATDEYLAGRGEEAPSSRPVRFVLYILSGNLGVMVKWAVITFFLLHLSKMFGFVTRNKYFYVLICFILVITKCLFS